jgi:SpoVK/Ycf46/Vps4 family AAA+-type ATPase
MTIDLENCRECKESRCIMSKYYGKSEQKIKEYEEEVKYQKRVKEEYNKKIKAYYEKETKYWKQFKDREQKLINYDRMNKSDRMHDKNWDLAINKLMELQEKYYNSIKY